MCSNNIRVKTLRQSSTPSNSRGRWSGKSTKVNLVWSGKAKHKGGWIIVDKISTSTLVFPGTGTGALNSLSIQVSISRMSCRMMGFVFSNVCPVNTLQTVSLQWEKRLQNQQVWQHCYLAYIISDWYYLLACLEAPTFWGNEFSLHASMIFFNTNKHSRNIVKKGWCDMMHSDVSEWFLFFCWKRDTKQWL